MPPTGPPPVAPRAAAADASPGAAPVRERILDSALRLVIAQGFAGTTVDAVIEDAAASKGAFFHHFPSKAHLGRALVERYAADDAAVLDAALRAAEAATDDPAEQLVALVAGFEAESARLAAEQPGCLFVSFLSEHGLTDPTTIQVVRDAIAHWRERILEKLQAAARAHPDVPAVDLPSLADQCFTTFEGAFLLARALDDPSRVGAQLAHLRWYLALLFGVDPDPRSPTT